MGCFVVKEAPPQQQQQQIFKNSEPCSARGSFLAAQLFIGNTSRGSFGENRHNHLFFLEISTMEEFRLTQSDLIGRKNRKIDEDYTLISPPIGKGIFKQVLEAIITFLQRLFW